MDLFTDLFDAYVAGKVPGGVLFVRHDAVHMAGASGVPSIELSESAVATAWGTYVHPRARGEGIADALRESMLERLQAMGFRMVVGEVLVGDETGYRSLSRSGYAPRSLVMAKDLS